MKLAFTAGFLVALGLAGILVSTIVRVKEHYYEVETDYGIILDAGSTSTKAYIYEWEHKTTNSLPNVRVSMASDKVSRTYKESPGIASIDPNSTSVAWYLDPIVEWASSIIPEDKRSSTPLYFQGTGGMRQLSPTIEGALLASVRTRLQDSGFDFDSTYASTLTGAQESAYGFLAVNGLYGLFNFGESTSDSKFAGSLDMGGVSSKIAFSSADHPPANYSFTADVNGTSISIYAQSNDGLGLNEARYTFNMSLYQNSSSSVHNISAVTDPCAPTGFYENATVEVNGQLQSFLLIGASNYTTCSAKVHDLVLQLTRNLPTPPIGDNTFVVSDHYLDIKKFFKLKDNANIIELQAKVSSFCGLDYGDAMNHHDNYANEVQNFCFAGNYLVTLLRDYYGFDPTLRHILWRDSINKTPVTWTLGSMLDVVNQIPPDTSDQTKTRFVRYFRTPGGVAVLFVSCLLVVLGIVLFILQRRRPSGYIPVR